MMNAAPPDITSVRPQTSSIPQNSTNPGGMSNFNMNQPIRQLGPPSAIQPRMSNFNPQYSQSPHTQGPRIQSPGGIGPPSNFPSTVPAVNGTGAAPPRPISVSGNRILANGN